ncbi:MAG: hypothetical protein J6Y07_03620 [Alphaproteobacteria bacterium]|nr:hypothetical protein [Alphaproteobacteria bacterium]
MKKQIATLLFGVTTCGTAFGAGIDWWNRNTICQINDTRCYAESTVGIDFSFETGWDISGNCRGKKFICAEALSTDASDSVGMERVDILRKNGISSDFDTDVYVSSGNCYGARKTSQNGTMALVDGEYVRVWCNGILSNPTGTVANGEITTNANPTCRELADMNYVATLNGNCYGKKYNPANYAIDCDGENPIIIILNGAEYDSNGRNPMTISTVNTLFDKMQANAAAQRAIHFPQ